MEILHETKDHSKKSFLGHVFSTTEEGKAELLNVVQYSFMGVIPVVILNKLIQRFIPEADPDKSTIELLAEIFIQLIIMFCGIIVIHRTITYFPTYSGFKFENLMLTNVILAFLIIVLSIQTKLGIKVNILVDRLSDLWNGTGGTGGTGGNDNKKRMKNGVRVSQPMSQHSSSQADYLDNNQVQSGMFPPAPAATSRPSNPMEGYDNMIRTGGVTGSDMYGGPMAANALLGSSFGSF
uniref:Uncharacterized protein n=1 Tax=viral metagenome TaxID=1070528 RepID=A0A6C0ARE5_9ZZZZ